MTDALMDILDQDTVNRMWQAQIKAALEGDIEALKLIANYLQGRPSQTIIHEGSVSNQIMDELRARFEGTSVLDQNDDAAE